MNIQGNRFFVWIVLVSMLAGMMGACTSPSASVEEDGPLTVMVSIMPQKYFVERIGGEHVTVDVMVEPGASPATYEPKPEQLQALSRAAAYFSIGVPFENAWLEKISEANEAMLMVDTIANIERRPMDVSHTHDDDDHDHDDDDHQEGPLDPHVWTSPELVKVQAQAIYAALAELDPAQADEYQANLDTFIADIDALEADIRQTLSGLASNKFMVFHPAWGYFAHDFGLVQIPVEVGGQEPSAQELAHLIEVAQEEDIRVIFAQPEFSTADAETIAREIGGEVLLISPLAYDWLENMRRVAETFAEVL